MSPHGLEDTDSAVHAYGYPGMGVPTGNGAGGDGY